MISENDICGQEFIQGIGGQIFWIGFEVVILVLGAYITFLWLKWRKQFPLSERSPFLSIFFLLNVMVYLLTYPAMMQFSILSESTQLVTKCLLLPFANSYIYIYLVKSIRLAWGFSNRRQKWQKKMEDVLDYIFSKEKVSILICLFLIIFYSLTSILASEGEYHEFDFIVSSPRDVLAIFANTLENVVALSLLIISIKIVSRVEPRVNFILELYLITVFDFILGGLRNCLLFVQQDDFCMNGVPLLYIVNSIKLVSSLYVSMISPLQILDSEHKYQKQLILNDLPNFICHFSENIQNFIQYCLKMKLILPPPIAIAIDKHISQSNPQISDLKASKQDLIHPEKSQIFNQSSSKISNLSHLTLHEHTLEQRYHQRSREEFLKKYDFTFSLIHLELYKNYLNITETLTETNKNQQFSQYLNQYLLNLLNNDITSIKSLFPVPLFERVIEWIQCNQIQSGCSENSEQTEKDIQLSKDIIEYSTNEIQQIVFEYQKTYSFKELLEEQSRLSSVYPHLLTLFLAYDQNIDV